jgi:L-aspartate oxidase
VVPAAHYQCGGVAINLDGETEIPGLYAVGEVSCTGLHGANRLASNSLLEAMVFAHRCAADSSLRINSLAYRDGIPNWNSSGTSHPKEMILITQSLKELQLLMSDYVGIVRTNVRLARAMKRLDLLWEETETLYQATTLSPHLCELRNMITVGYLIVKCAQLRKESRGLHYNTDYPTRSGMLMNIVL